MAPESDDKARREAEDIQRQMEFLESRRGETQAATSSAIRRTLTVLGVFLIGYLLWRSYS